MSPDVDIYAKHGRLVSLSFVQPLTPTEAAALQELRDEIDRREEALLRPSLARMERIVEAHEALAADVQRALAEAGRWEAR